MRTKLMLEALAAWLALAAASAPAWGSIESGANHVLTTVANPVVADPRTSLDEITGPYSNGHVPASGSIRANADLALLAPAPTRNGASTRSRSGVSAPARGSFKLDVRQSQAAADFSLPGADDFTPGRKNGYDTELKRRAVFNRHEAASQAQGVLVAANGGSGLNAEKFYVIADAKPAPGPTVPEPGNWATLLAGLFGAIAIARRRMSL